MQEQETKEMLEVQVLSKFDVTKNELTEFIGHYTNLLVTEETYEEAKKARMVIREKRYLIQNQQAINDKARIEWNKRAMSENKAKAEELIGILLPTEEVIDAGIKEIEAKKEAERLQREAEKKAIIDDRIKKITDTGASLGPIGYTLDDQFIAPEEIETMSDRSFNAVLGHFVFRAETIAKAKAEEEARIKAEEEAKEKARQEEERKFKADQEALAKQKVEQDAREAAFKAQQEAKEKEEADRLAKIKQEEERIASEKEALRLQTIRQREKSLFSLGFSKTADGYRFNTIHLYPERMEDPAEKWETLLSEVEARVQTIKDKIEEDKRKEAEAAEQKAKAEAEEEARRKAALVPDKERILKWAAELLAMTGPDLI